jgi:peptide/nickel transport system permease protein
MTVEQEPQIGGGRTENLKTFLYFARSNPLYAFGLFFTAIYLVYSAAAGIDPHITGFNPTQTNLNLQLQPPSLRYPFGTDAVGRNLFLEVLYGAPIDAGASVAIVLFSFIIGLISGSVAGYFGGWVDEVIMRVTDIFLAFPGLVLAVAVAAALGPGLVNAIFAVAVVWWPVYTRIARGETLTVKEQQYITAAKAAGVGRTRIVLDHVIPNVVVPMIAYATADFGNVIILFSVLGFLGLGAQPPHSDLGRIVYDGLNYIQFAPWYPILPGVTIFVIVLAFAFLGDLVRDYLDPRRRR